MADDTDFDLDEFPDTGSGGTTSSGGGGDGSKGGRRGRWIWLLLGVALGVAAALLAPRYVAPHLPPALGGGLVTVQGEVLDKERESGRLLFTLDSERGAMLATFRDRISELDLLVGRGDSVTLAMAEFRPFVDDPNLVGVKKGTWEGRVPASPDDAGPGADADTARATPETEADGDRGPEADADTEPPSGTADSAGDPEAATEPADSAGRDDGAGLPRPR